MLLYVSVRESKVKKMSLAIKVKGGELCGGLLVPVGVHFTILGQTQRKHCPLQFNLLFPPCWIESDTYFPHQYGHSGRAS